MQIQTYTQNGCCAQINTHKMQTFNHSNLKKKQTVKNIKRKAKQKTDTKFEQQSKQKQTDNIIT